VRIACDAAKTCGRSHPPPPGHDVEGSGSAAVAAQALVNRASELKSLDNVTVLVAWLLWDDSSAACSSQ